MPTDVRCHWYRSGYSKTLPKRQEAPEVLGGQLGPGQYRYGANYIS